MTNTIFQFFGLRENPFRINPDPRFLFVTERARATFDELSYAIRTRKGLILLTGEVGTGKTMLLRRLLDWLAEQKMPAALIFNSHIKSDHLLDFILNDFGVPCTSTLKSEKLLALNTWLLERYRAGQIPVLIVDEAQGLEPSTLEEIRLLLNFETPREKLLQIILAGQPELETKLKRHDLRQLRQRITIRCRTAPLTPEQTDGYISERLHVAGANGHTIFEPEAVRCVHAYSRGIPRVINVLCEHCLINACADGARTISPSLVERAAYDCQLDRAESIARILDTGSYSTDVLSDVSAILARVSASSETPHEAAIPQQPSIQSSDPSQNRYTRHPAAATAQPFASPATVRLQQPAASNARQEPFNPLRAVPDAAPAPQAYSAQPELPSELPSVPQRISRRPSLLAFLNYWGASFAADARASARQVRRAVQSYGRRTWMPLVRSLRHEFKVLPDRASRFFSDPRWQRLRSQAASASLTFWNSSQKLWNSFWTALSTKLAQRSRTDQEPDAKGGQPARANRRRAIISLRRWLHEPLASQRKTLPRNRRRY